MNKRIASAFQNGPAFIGFLTAGDPDEEQSFQNLLALAEGGADLVELGLPFSDPIAEGPVIQGADLRALASGATTETVFRLAARLRAASGVPMVIMTYYNPVFHYGCEAFCKRCRESGVDGLIVPDLPFEEREELLAFTKAEGLDLISMVAPTSGGRIEKIAGEAEGFLYVVSSMGVTGMRSDFETDLEAFLEEIKRYAKAPVCVGFGVSTPEQAARLARLSDGVIVGSALVKLAEAYGTEAPAYIRSFAQEMKAAVRMETKA